MEPQGEWAKQQARGEEARRERARLYHADTHPVRFTQREMRRLEFIRHLRRSGVLGPNGAGNGAN